MISIWNDEVSTILENQGKKTQALLWKIMNVARIGYVISWPLAMVVIFTIWLPNGENGTISSTDIFLMVITGGVWVLCSLTYYFLATIQAILFKDYLSAVGIFVTPQFGMFIYRYWKGSKIRKSETQHISNPKKRKTSK